MNLCRVTDTIVASVKSPRLRSHRLLAVRRLGLDGSLTSGAEDIALDPGLDAGIGDTVLIAKEGAVVADLFDRALADDESGTPANVVIVAIVDAWTVGDETVEPAL